MKIGDIVRIMGLDNAPWMVVTQQDLPQCDIPSCRCEWFGSDGYPRECVYPIGVLYVRPLFEPANGIGSDPSSTKQTEAADSARARFSGLADAIGSITATTRAQDNLADAMKYLSEMAKELGVESQVVLENAQWTGGIVLSALREALRESRSLADEMQGLASEQDRTIEEMQKINQRLVEDLGKNAPGDRAVWKNTYMGSPVPPIVPVAIHDFEEKHATKPFATSPDDEQTAGAKPSRSPDRVPSRDIQWMWHLVISARHLLRQAHQSLPAGTARIDAWKRDYLRWESDWKSRSKPDFVSSPSLWSPGDGVP